MIIKAADMLRAQRGCLFYGVFTGLLCSGQAALALEFEPGAGVAVEYTDNARLTAADAVNDTITAAYVGARLAEESGPLTYDATAAFNNHSYMQDTFKDQRYFNLAAKADWEMIKDRFDWIVSDFFSQRPVNTLDANTPDNLQDTNAFSFAANIKFPLSPRQSFSIRPEFSQFYYETQSTDNRQLSLAANWNYQLYRLTGIGLNASSRQINYSDSDAPGNSIADTTFTNLAFLINAQRQRSSYAINLGATNVSREGGGDGTGFAGSIDWSLDMTSRSTFRARISTDLTDTSRVALSSVQDPSTGSPDDVQVTTDVVRNTIFNLSYLREDASLKSTLWANYREVTYSDSPLDREIQGVGLQLSYPVNQLLSTAVYANYNHTKELDTARIDERYTIGGNLNYRFSRKWHSLFDIKYRSKDSTDASQNYDELSVFATLVYGFGEVLRPTRVGGF